MKKYLGKTFVSIIGLRRMANALKKAGIPVKKDVKVESFLEIQNKKISFGINIPKRYKI